MADSSDEFESDLSCESEYESVESSDEWESESSSEEEEVDSDSEVVEGGKRGVSSGSVSSKSKRQKPAKFKTKNNSVCENDISTKKRTLFAPSDGLLLSMIGMSTGLSIFASPTFVQHF